MAVKIKGNTRGITWGSSTAGVTSGALGTKGIIVSAKRRVDGKISEIGDEDDETVIVVLYDDHSVLDLEVITGSDSALPARGDAVTICGVVGVVLNCEVGFTKGKEKTMRVSAKKWEELEAEPTP